MAENIVHSCSIDKGESMGLSYEDLSEPAIVRQESKSVAYCRCTPDQEPALLRRFSCRNKHNTAHFGIRGANDYCHLSLLEIKGSPVLRRHTRPAGETQRTSTKAARLETMSYQADRNVPGIRRVMIDDRRRTAVRWSESDKPNEVDGAFSFVGILTGGTLWSR
jgi:hypothetical protein